MTQLKNLKKFELLDESNELLNNLLVHYDESSRKQARRKFFYDRLLEIIILEDKFNLTFSEIAKELEVERKTLYRYFDSKDEIISDIAYLCVVYINGKYLNVTKEVMGLDYDNTTRLKLIFRDIANVMINYKKLFSFYQYFDLTLYELPLDSKASLRYRQLITEFKRQNHYLGPILVELRNEGKLVDKYTNEELAEIFEQAFGVFVSRTIVKMRESDRYKLENINVLIDIMLNGIIM